MRTIKALLLAAQRPDTASEIAERSRAARVAEMVKAERRVQFPDLATADFDAVVRWQELRISQLMAPVAAAEA
jgi:hypothetical protein